MAESIVSQVGDFTLVHNSLSPLNGVIFHNVKPVYTAEEPVKCVYSITDCIEPESDDVIGLFKVGWISPLEIFSSVPAKFPVNKEKTFLHSVFEGHQLPSDSADMFQFCYVTKKGVVGASTPFTFDLNEIIAVEDPADPGLLVFKSRVSQLKDQLLRLSDEKNYYASKCEIHNANFLKLKIEFDKLEEELNKQRQITKELEEKNMLLANEIRDFIEVKKADLLTTKETDIVTKETDIVTKETDIVTKETDLDRELNKCEFVEDSELNNEIFNSAVWKSLFEIYEVVTDIKYSMNSNTIGQERMSYKALIDYVLEVFSSTKNKFQLKVDGEIDESKYCKCYHLQKAFSCPTLCSDKQFQYMMTQPLYTCFSNFNHYTEDGSTGCDGSFDLVTLSDYIKNVCQPTDATKSTESIGIDVSSPSTNIDEHQVIKKITEERDKATSDLKDTKEKIATLNSRVNVLELELVAQLSNQQKRVDNLNGNENNCLAFSDIENILESVNNEYLNLKGKYNELSKKVASNHSIEMRCALLEEENKILVGYFNGALDQNKEYVISDRHLSTDLKNLIVEKKKAETTLINLQKESIGKVSCNLIHENYQE